MSLSSIHKGSPNGEREKSRLTDKGTFPFPEKKQAQVVQGRNQGRATGEHASSFTSDEGETKARHIREIASPHNIPSEKGS